MTRPTRPRLIAALIAAPAIVSALGLTLVEGYRLIDPAAPLFGDPRAESMAAAITGRRGVEQVYAFIHAGRDPNDPIAVDDPDYTGGPSIPVAPLIAAIAARDPTVVQMLLDYGVRLELPQNRDAWCFARALGDEEIAGIIARSAQNLSPPCPDRPVDPARPLAWVE
jgi:hypothetical protein